MTSPLLTPSGNATANEASSDGIAILLCTHFGERFIEQQLESIKAQNLTDWRVWVSDDGSTDRTLGILGEYRRQWGDERLSIRSGPSCGFRANFLSLVCASDIRARYYSFADQDDLWDADKLETAATWLDRLPSGVPGLYCARTRLIDVNGRVVGSSPLFASPVSFRNALVQSIAGGNTMMLNNAARKLLIEAGADVNVQTHDWWAYLVVTGCGGNVFYDPRPTIGYRQHRANLVGSNASVLGRARRAARLMSGRFRDMNNRNIGALKRLVHRMAPENLRVLEEFERSRNSGLFGRIAGIRRSGVYCHTRLGNMGLAAATLLKKL
jgi:glycosyltransferase involved in cell wall biosynthesis